MHFTKKFHFILCFLLLIYLLPIQVIAGSSTILNYIGNLSTPQAYSQWWYTSENPQLKGQVDANAVVTITIDDQSQTVNADSQGIWVYNPTNLLVGDRQVTVQSGANNYTFTLTIGSGVPAGITTSQSTDDSLMQAGSISNTLIISLFGLGLILIGGISLATLEKKS